MFFPEFGHWIQQCLGVKCQKIGINAGFTCPNRDGQLGRGGCAYCNNQSFNPAYIQKRQSITEQLEAGKLFFRRKYNNNSRFLAYFQSYTSTYDSVDSCIERYEEALRVTDVVGLIISTRPDCMPLELLDYFEHLKKRTFVLIEYGVESANDNTLRLMNRGHDFATARETIYETARRGITVGAHLILGFPGEDHAELMRQARLIAQLPLDTLKLHQLQLIRGTALARTYTEQPWELPTVSQYISIIVDYLSLLPPTLVIDRFVSQSPSHLLLAPRWGMKQQEINTLIRTELKKRFEKVH